MELKTILSPLLFAAGTAASPAAAQELPAPATSAIPTDSLSETTTPSVSLKETTVSARRRGLYRSFDNMENMHTISAHELTRAACCNLGESFVTNPSVDVNYSDAATGARQIRLLGLAGTYVQMMTENIPNFRIAAQPYGLSYVPGPWMESIQVSKGASSVKNGYEAITGQINTELRKPEQLYPNLLSVNGYADMRGRIEGNVESTLRLNPRWGTTILGHYDKHLSAHDDNNDGFADMPQQEQFNLANRWTYSGEKIHSALFLRGLSEKRKSGQIVDHAGAAAPSHGAKPYIIDLNTKRFEGFAKNAYMFGDAHRSNIALILSGSWHEQNSLYGVRTFDMTQTNGYASLMFETRWTEAHSLSIGTSFNYDRLRRTQIPTSGWLSPSGAIPKTSTESVPGAYAQYTFDLDHKLTIMGGLRIDHSNLYGTFLTPRAHLKFAPNKTIALRLTAGKGYRTTHVPEEYNFYLAGSRRMEWTNEHLREEAWNYGGSITLRLPLAERMLNLNTEYYYTDFLQQAVVDFDSSPHAVRFYQLDGRSYSSVFQIEASYPFFEGFTLTAAYRLTDVKTTYDLPTGKRLLEKPLQGRYKAIFTASYATPLEKWQFDATLQLNGGGRMPTPYTLPSGERSWTERYKTYPQLSAQITRNFRRWSIYAGGENLTGFRQNNALIDAQNPWGGRFDPTMVYGPVDGAMIYVGFRYTLSR